MTIVALFAQAADTAAVGQPFSISALLTPEGMRSFVRAALVVLVGIPLLFAISRWIRRALSDRISAQRGMVVSKLVFYLGAVLIFMTALSEAGYSLGPLLGAAGVLGIALGFASQTSISNVISGFFLMGEEPFVVDDVIQVGSTLGRVLSIDMMSVKLRTFDNRFVRIPNEVLIKSEVTTLTRFPIRRVELKVGIAYKEDASRVNDLLLEVADANPICLMEPEPQVFHDGYGDSSVNLRLVAWAARERWWDLRNSLTREVKERFDEEGIEIPFPHRSLYAGLATEPFPVRLVDQGEERAGGESKGVRAGAEEDEV